MGCADILKSRNAKIAIAVVLCVGLLLTVILVPLSLSHVEYYEYGLQIRKTTGQVDTKNVYGRGRYVLGPIYDFIKYQADAHHEDFDELSVYSSGGSNSSIGLEFKVDVDFTFLLKEDEVGQLHKELASAYKNIIFSRAKDAIKNEAVDIKFDEYFQDRQTVEDRFRDAVQRRWDENPSVHSTLDQFHLGRIRIPESVANKQLESRVQNERNDKEAFLQQAQVERERTAVDVNKILLQKENILRTARAEADLERSKAQAESEKIRAEAQVNGTALLFQGAGITNEEHMTAFTYIRTLANRENIDVDISYLSPDKVVPTTAL